MAKKILITGAGGFIGGFMVAEALKRGYETWAAVRATTSREFLKDERIHFIELDYSNGEVLQKQIADAVGFKTASAVHKRIAKIAAAYEDFVTREYQKFLD